MKIMPFAAAIIVLTSTPAQARWEFAQDTDGFSDAKSARAFIIAKNSALAVKCDEARRNSIYIHVYSTEFLGEDINPKAPRGVEFRFDSNKSQRSDWKYGDNDIMLLNNDLAKEFARAIAMSKTLKVRAVDYRISKFVDMEFDLTGSMAAMKRIGEACSDPFL